MFAKDTECHQLINTAKSGNQFLWYSITRRSKNDYVAYKEYYKWVCEWVGFNIQPNTEWVILGTAFPGNAYMNT